MATKLSSFAIILFLLNIVLICYLPIIWDLAAEYVPTSKLVYHKKLARLATSSLALLQSFELFLGSK